MTLRYEIFLQWNTNFFSSECSGSFISWILLKLYYLCKSCNRKIETLERKSLSTGEPCTCEYVTLLQSFDRVTLSIHWYIAQKFSCPSFFKRLFRIAIFSRFSKVAIATSNLMNEFYNGGFSPEFSVSVFKEIIALVRDYVSETRK